jgi:WD40 repeat protein
VTYIQTDFPITAICLAEAGNELFTGGIDNDIKVWDLRKQAVTYTLLGHTDTVTSLQMSPDNQTLLSNAHDSTVRTWDVRPFAPADRRIQTYDGAPTGQERNLLKASWDSTGEKIAAGSGDQSVAIWETRTGKLLNKLPGHRGTVNDVRFHPRGEPICKCVQILPVLSSSRFFQYLRSEAAISDTSTHSSNMVLQKTLRCGGFVFGALALRMSELLKTLTRLFHAYQSIYRTT